MSRNRVYTQIGLAGIHSSGRSYGFVGSKRIYVDYGIPGETIDATNVRRNGDHLLGRVKEATNTSPGRVQPFCRHFGICGGCEWQHMDYSSQLHWKREILVNALKKYSIPTPEIPLPVPSPTETHYRHRLDYDFSNRRWYYEGEGKVDDPLKRLALGFHPADNPDKVIDIEECFLQAQPGRNICEAIKALTLNNNYPYFDPKEQSGLMRSISIRVNRKGEAMVVVSFLKDAGELIETLLEKLSGEIPAIKSLWWTVVPERLQSWQDTDLYHFGNSDSFLMEESNGLRFRISPKSFYQPNPAQAGNIFTEVSRLADCKGDELVYDLYSGIGTLAISVAGKAGKVIGIEGSEAAVSDAIHNAEINGMDNCKFTQGDVLLTFTPGFVDLHGKPSLVILDPPRSGTLIEIKKTILQASPSKIIYLSCNPLSLAFDLKMLCQEYEVTYIRPYDQFPQTHHLETLVMLEKMNRNQEPV